MPNSISRERVNTRATSSSVKKGNKDRRQQNRGTGVVGSERGKTANPKKRAVPIASNNDSAANKKNRNGNETNQIMSLRSVAELNTSSTLNRIQLSTNATATTEDRGMNDGNVRDETLTRYDDDDSCKGEEEKSLLGIETDLIEYFSSNKDVDLSRFEKKLFDHCVKVCHKHGFDCSIMGLVNTIEQVYKKYMSTKERVSGYEKDKSKMSTVQLMERREDFDKFVRQWAMKLFKAKFTMVSNNFVYFDEYYWNTNIFVSFPLCCNLKV